MKAKVPGKFHFLLSVARAPARYLAGYKSVDDSGFLKGSRGKVPWSCWHFSVLSSDVVRNQEEMT